MWSMPEMVTNSAAFKWQVQAYVCGSWELIFFCFDDLITVLTGFEKGKQIDERSIRLSTSHKLGVKHLLATQYATDLKGDSFGATSCMTDTQRLNKWPMRIVSEKCNVTFETLNKYAAD